MSTINSPRTRTAHLTALYSPRFFLGASIGRQLMLYWHHFTSVVWSVDFWPSVKLERNNNEPKLLTSLPAFIQNPHHGWAHWGHQAAPVLREALPPPTEGKLWNLQEDLQHGNDSQDQLPDAKESARSMAGLLRPVGSGPSRKTSIQSRLQLLLSTTPFSLVISCNKLNHIFIRKPVFVETIPLVSNGPSLLLNERNWIKSGLGVEWWLPKAVWGGAMKNYWLMGTEFEFEKTKQFRRQVVVV